MKIRVEDNEGNGIRGIGITFAVGTWWQWLMGARVNPASDTTDNEGYAETTLTLGRVRGAYSVVATGTNTTPTSVTFSATATGITITITRLNPPASPPNDKTFITTDIITLEAKVMSGITDVTSQASINWSGGETPPTGSGSTFSTKYSTASNHTVTASASYQRASDSDSFTLEQDNKDQLRQEYINVYQQTPLGRGWFDQEPSPVYPRLLHKPTDICDLHDWWIVKDLIGWVDELDYAYAGALRATSGYRCPLGNVRAKGTKLSRHMKGRAADYGQSTPQANYDVWVASGTSAVGATERILYDVAGKEYKNPEPPKDGKPAYRHGHAGW